MLILLSASKKKMGSFVTPTTPQSNVNIFSVEANGFKYGALTMTAFPSFKRDGGAFVGASELASSLVAYTESTAFTYSRTISSSAYVSYQDASFLYFGKTVERAFTVSSQVSGLIMAPGQVEKAFSLSFLKIVTMTPASNSSGQVFAVSNGQVDDGSQMYSSNTGTIQQTLSIQPESF